MAEADARPTNAPEITVSELANALKRAIEDRFGYVRVRGEISGYRGRQSSGHAYFCLKDANARLDAVVWRTSRRGAGNSPRRACSTRRASARRRSCREWWGW